MCYDMWQAPELTLALPWYSNESPCIFTLHQGSFDHVKVGPRPVLELHNLWRQIYMFLDILEFRVENRKKY